MGRGIFVLPRCQHLIDRALAHVHQHVCVSEALYRAHLVALHRRYEAVDRLSSIILFEHLAIRNGRDAIIVELEPAGLTIGLDQREVVATVQVPRVNKDTVQSVYPRLRPVSSFIEELPEVNLEGKFVTVVDLWTT